MKQPIKIVRGTTATFSIPLINQETGELYAMTDGEELIFSICRNELHGAFFFKAAAKDADGIPLLTIDPGDTEALEPGRYFYDIMLHNGADCYPVVPFSPLDLVPSSQTGVNA